MENEGNDPKIEGQQEPKTITRTQEEFDKIIQDRVTRATEKFADYQVVKDELANLKKTQETDIERQVREAREAVEGQVAERITTATSGARAAIVAAELRAAAASAGFKYPDDVVTQLSGNKKIKVSDDFKVEGIKDLVDQLAKDRPEWLAGTRSTFNGAPARQGSGAQPPAGAPDQDQARREAEARRRQRLGVASTI